MDLWSDPIGPFLCSYVNSLQGLAARSSRRRCKRAGGICFSGPCPRNYRFAGICSRKYSCCQR
uniref:Beta-defensin-like domain-containing protein n=1 Tax=Chelydra serpentina TaxID=8475 RepID=A0A8C3TCQ4_CHESE